MIELKNIQVEFSRDGASATAAVDDVSLTILEGEVFGIIGSSGAGKSTLVRTINLLQKPTSGDIVIDGASIVGQTGARLRETRCGIGMIFQHFNLWNAKTVYDNVAFPLKCARWSKQDIEERVVELLEFVNLEEKRDAYPQTLSGGQKQRVAIARALAANTRILLCDEPTSALDLETTKSVLDVLKRVNEQLGVTIVVITHELDVVKGICDRIAVMDGGRVVEQGETYEVFSNPQSEMLRGLVRHSQNFALPSGAFEQNGSIIKLTYAGESATEPVLFDAGKLFDVRLSILHGKIEYINEKPFGICTCEPRRQRPNRPSDRASERAGRASGGVEACRITSARFYSRWAKRWERPRSCAASRWSSPSWLAARWAFCSTLPARTCS